MSDQKRCIFDNDRVICEDQLKVALFRADRAFETEVNIANIWGIEVLIHMTATHQISDALDLVGISAKTTSIGVIQDTKGLPHPRAVEGIDISETKAHLVELYELSTNDLCDEIIAKGVRLIADHE